MTADQLEATLLLMGFTKEQGLGRYYSHPKVTVQVTRFNRTHVCHITQKFPEEYPTRYNRNMNNALKLILEVLDEKDQSV